MHLLRTMDWNGLEGDYQFLDGKLVEAMKFFRKAIPGTLVTQTMKTIYNLPQWVDGGFIAFCRLEGRPEAILRLSHSDSLRLFCNDTRDTGNSCSSGVLSLKSKV